VLRRHFESASDWPRVQENNFYVISEKQKRGKDEKK
jgi:hypothetical protein